MKVKMLVEFKENIRRTMLYLLVTNRVIMENKKARFLPTRISKAYHNIFFFNLNGVAQAGTTGRYLRASSGICQHPRLFVDLSHVLTKY